MLWPKKNPGRKPKPSSGVKNIPAGRLSPPQNLDKPCTSDRTPLPPFDTGFVYYEEK